MVREGGVIKALASAYGLQVYYWKLRICGFCLVLRKWTKIQNSFIQFRKLLDCFLSFLIYFLLPSFLPSAKIRETDHILKCVCWGTFLCCMTIKQDKAFLSCASLHACVTETARRPVCCRTPHKHGGFSFVSQESICKKMWITSRRRHDACLHSMQIGFIMWLLSAGRWQLITGLQSVHGQRSARFFFSHTSTSVCCHWLQSTQQTSSLLGHRIKSLK